MAAAYTTLVAYIVLAGAQVIFARKVHLKETGEKSVYNDNGYADFNRMVGDVNIWQYLQLGLLVAASQIKTDFQSTIEVKASGCKGRSLSG